MLDARKNVGVAAFFRVSYSRRAPPHTVAEMITTLYRAPVWSSISMRRQALRARRQWRPLAPDLSERQATPSPPMCSPMPAEPNSAVSTRIIYKSGHDQRCFGTANSGWPHAGWAHPSRACPCSGMSPSFGPILGEQGQQPADECRRNPRQHRAGPHSARGNSVLNTHARSTIALNCIAICR